MCTVLEYTELALVIGRSYESSGYEQALRVYAKQLAEIYSQGAYIPTWYIGSIYGFQGDKDRAFAWLEKAYLAKEGIDQLSDPMWDPMRSDPRFKDLLRRVGLPQMRNLVLEP